VRGVSVHASAAVRGRDGRGRSSGRLHARWRARAVEAGRCASVQARARTRSSSGGVAWRGEVLLIGALVLGGGVGSGGDGNRASVFGGERAAARSPGRQCARCQARWGPGAARWSSPRMGRAGRGGRKGGTEESASRARLRCELAGAAYAGLFVLTRAHGREMLAWTMSANMYKKFCLGHV